MDTAELRSQLTYCAVKRRRYIKRADQETETLRGLVRQAIAAGMPKSHVAELAEISRPTLDAWLDGSAAMSLRGIVE